MRNTLTSRYFFRGTLIFLSAMHIGGGKVQYRATDSPVVRTADGMPFIPGSSFKGVFRSTVERLTAALPGLEPCQLYDKQSDCPTVHQQEYNSKRKNLNEEDFFRLINRSLCSCCRVFGSPYSAGKLYFQDLYPSVFSGIIPVRDGVSLDRDSGKAVETNKYDFEVVEAGSVFNMELLLDEPEGTDLALVCLGLQELAAGLCYIGGMRSRGLGNCRLENLQIYCLDLSGNDETKRLAKLSQYLRGKSVEEKMDLVDNPQKMLDQQISALLDLATATGDYDENNGKEGGVSHA